MNLPDWESVIHDTRVSVRPPSPLWMRNNSLNHRDRPTVRPAKRPWHAAC